MDRIQGKFTELTLRKFLNRLQLRYSVSVIQTDGIDSTASLCQTLLDQIVADPKVFVAEDGAQKDYAHCVTVKKSTNKDDPRTFASLILQQCPGISATVADTILKGGGEVLRGVMALSEAEIAALSVTEKRKVGQAVAKRLWALLHA